jgi:UDP-N-acetylmuramoyl-tripeptide--D-alanyl-D-alanine ligase
MMPNTSLRDIATASNAFLHGADGLVSSVGIDTRAIIPGGLFVALRGEHVDGHEFLSEAKHAGAVGAVVETLQAIDIPQIVVADAAVALGDIASYNRSLFKGAVVAITGSAGKTTCKNMLRSILAEVASVSATQGNLNNELGVPLTLLKLDETQQYAVIEMGAAKAGDIAYLTRIARPDIGVVTNISEAHLGRFGSLQITAQTKGEIYDSLPAKGVAVINRDEPFASDWQARLHARADAPSMLSFSVSDLAADIVASNVEADLSGVRFTVSGDAISPGWSIEVSLQLLGGHNVANALGSIAIAKALHISDQAIVAGLGKLNAESGRLQRRGARNALTLIDDSYNANPAAMRAAIDTVVGNKQSSGHAHLKPVFLVLGDMAELGPDAAQLHHGVGEYAADQGIDCLLAWGMYASSYVDGFMQVVGDSPKHADVFASQELLADYLLSESCRGAVVLIKGSRSAGMEQLVELLATDRFDQVGVSC